MKYCILSTDIGFILIAATDKGICKIEVSTNANQLEKDFLSITPSAHHATEDANLQQWTSALKEYLNGTKSWPSLPYDIKGTSFQHLVWEYLYSIPSGTTYHYNEVAKAIGHPKAVRAVASSCARNPVALVIPCHRILPKSGGVGNYYWGSDIKQQLLTLENHHIY